MKKERKGEEEGDMAKTGGSLGKRRGVENIVVRERGREAKRQKERAYPCVERHF